MPFIPSLQARMAAEWEPATGVLIAWPPSLPHRLIIELAKDVKLYTLVENTASRRDAIQWLTKWGIMPDRVRFITAPQGKDVSWTRDWGPHAVFTGEGAMKMVDGDYRLSTPVSGFSCEDTLRFPYYNLAGNIIYMEDDDRLPGYITPLVGVNRLTLPFAFTGGNVLADGQRAAFSTCIITNENRYKGVSGEAFFADMERIFGITSYHIISNFEEEGIQHIDCFMKLLDEERMLVARCPKDHPLYEQYEGIVSQELSRMTNAYGRPYQILRIDTDRYEGDELAAYTNSLILNTTVYVPLFGIAQDSVALRQWQEAMPGYKVNGFEFRLDKEPALSEDARKHYRRIGWNSGDALHCRTRAIWDTAMIYISVDRLPASVTKAKSYTIRAIIKDYGLRDPAPESMQLMFRLSGTKEWKATPLEAAGIPDHFSATIPGGQAGVGVEYYVVVRNRNGLSATMPRPAPEGYYTFRIE